MHTPRVSDVIPHHERSPSTSSRSTTRNVHTPIVSNGQSYCPMEPGNDIGLELLAARLDDASINGPEARYPPSSSLPASCFDYMIHWMDDPEPASPLTWLGSESGRSAAAQSIANKCRISNRLAGSYFFHKPQGADTDRQNRALIIGISYQLAKNVDVLRGYINSTVAEDPSVLDKSLEVQFQDLIVQPFIKANALHLPPLLVVIDGLDEESIQEQYRSQVLDLITNAVPSSKIPLRFLITNSGPHVKNGADSSHTKYSSQTILLDDHISCKEDLFISDIANDKIRPVNSRSSDAPRSIMGRLLASKNSNSASIPKHPKRSSSLDSFPTLVTALSANNFTESYSRSLMMTGHGIPLWYPNGDLGKPLDYLRKGVSIGDVGTLDSDGLFDFCFNIFLPPDHPAHSGLAPSQFQPLEPALDPTEVEVIPQYFTAGHTITSQGIDVTKKSSQPLQIQFSSTEREGGIIVLPSGGSRENLRKTDRIHKYVKQYAAYWYQDVNGYGGVVHTNGSLFLVTGCDKADDWAVAAFPSFPGGKARLELTYAQQPDYGDPWTHNSSARTSFYAPSETRPIPPGHHQCVFVRGMRISLSDKSWQKTMPQTDSTRLFCTYILRTPSSIEMFVDNLLVYLRLRMSERRAMSKVTPSRQQLFHPNFVIGQELLKLAPESDVALVDDSVWCSLTHKAICTTSEVNKLVTAVFAHSHVVQCNGIVSLQSKAEVNNEALPRTLSEEQSFLSKLFSIPGLKKRRKEFRWIEDITVSQHAKLF